MIKIKIQIVARAQSGVSVVTKEFVTEMPDIPKHRELNIAEYLHHSLQKAMGSIVPSSTLKKG